MSQTSSFSNCSHRRFPNALTRAWIMLIALSLTSAILTLFAIPPKLLGACILVLALAKSHIILAQYLDLAASPTWLRGFSMVLTGFALSIFGIYLI